ncbi:MAG: hypothetical protein LBK41_06615 [Clostridiales bacterium]|nr:hypothetical protein [Clostridiales bacterium]
MCSSGPNERRKRLTVLAVCVLFIVVYVLSTAFIFAHACHIHDHNGSDGGCAVCAHLASARDLLKSISAAVAGAAFVFAGLSAVLSIPQFVGSRAGFRSLVHLKVRLNN